MHQLNFQSMKQITSKDYDDHHSSKWVNISFKGFNLCITAVSLYVVTLLIIAT